MIILSLRTDKPEAEIGVYNDTEQLSYLVWPAHRALAETIHARLKEELEKQKLVLQDLQAIVVFEGPGSFTGLRIGMSVANALATSLDIPIVGASGEQWVTDGIAHLQRSVSARIALPHYGALPNVSAPRK